MISALHGRPVDEHQMTEGLYAAVSSNGPTAEKISNFYTSVSALTNADKASLLAAIDANIEPTNFLRDRSVPLAAIPNAIFKQLKQLASHLYERTTDLAGVEATCGETVSDHFSRFRNTNPPGNGNVCCVCGTESLAQIQSNTEDGQWRGPYDHILPKDKYPLYGIHPGNLIPICHTCNSKAKLAKDLLFSGIHRRLSFCPWTEVVHPNEIQVGISSHGGFPQLVVSLTSACPNRREKLQTWDDIYKIRARVEGEFLPLFEKISEEIPVETEAAFLEGLTHSANARANKSRLTAFNYWRARLYKAVIEMDRGAREALRGTIKDETSANVETDALFFRPSDGLNNAI
ncbi:hypothetical protein NG829_06385 [Xanthomonas sacchari]|uniref:hypothetical protein n=1 Tax=Xanthomonas sacchari TaxID=56458 RepID=UPI00225E438D|nr:hypothetical protein [Xanthomonas sacchari]UYK81931.1 hypothetical protein NG829_06385 [Xanthomonas sacchari]